MADPSWLLGVVIVVSVVLGIFFIILVTLLMYFCWWKRRTPRGATYNGHVHDDSSSMTLSTDSGGKLSSRHGNGRAVIRNRQRMGNGFFTVPATRVHHDQRWRQQHRRDTPVGRYKVKKMRSRTAPRKDIHSYRGRSTQSDIGFSQHRRNAKSLDSKSVQLFLTESGNRLPRRVHMQAQGFAAQNMTTGNNNYALTRDDDYSLGGATLGGISNFTTIVNGQPHRYHAGTRQTGNLYVASVETASDAITSTPRDDRVSISGPVLSSDREIIPPGSRYSPNGYNTLPSGPTWVVNSNSRDHSFVHSDASNNSRISGPLLVSDTTDAQSRDIDVLW